MNKHEKFTALITVLFAVAVTTVIGCQCLAAEADSLSEGLVMYLSFDTIDDISGQKLIVDESGSENHGTLLSGKLVEGKVGNALFCSAINKADGVRVKDHDSLDLDKVTMVAWIKTQQVDGQWNRILDKSWRTGYNLCVGGDYQGKTLRRRYASVECASRCTPSKTPVVDNQWHLIVGTYDGKTLELYIDGKLDIVKKLKPSSEQPGQKRKWDEAAPMKHNDVDIMIGQLAAPEPNPHEHAYFDGLIDEVRLYNRILSAEEIALLYQSQQ